MTSDSEFPRVDALFAGEPPIPKLDGKPTIRLIRRILWVAIPLDILGVLSCTSVPARRRVRSAEGSGSKAALPDTREEHEALFAAAREALEHVSYDETIGRLAEADLENACESNAQLLQLELFIMALHLASSRLPGVKYSMPLGVVRRKRHAAWKVAAAHSRHRASRPENAA